MLYVFATDNDVYMSWVTKIAQKINIKVQTKMRSKKRNCLPAKIMAIFDGIIY